ncbi:sodium-coupled monocarboxylate transporter 1-like isoform X2 [Rhodnius prolixus]|uniref:sodium-coupled monocarboxylate transporter 1-like isoform X2 n=1 Tax=Rhodnius prolixus TaxID=13249 RepID=UPI003D189B75
MDPRNEFTLSWWDYLLLILTLGSSALIGIYYSFSKKKPKTLDEYMFGSMNMPWLPILLSNVSSAISSAAIVVLPRETFYYGNQMMFIPIAELSTLFYNYFFFLPVLLKLRFTSIFEYLEKRFNKFVRCCGSLIYFATQMMFSIITIYSAGKAVAEVLPISFYIFTPAACMLCTVYTALGGLRGVVWVDAVQAIIMFLSISIFIIVGIYDVGGVQKVIDTYENGGRTDINLLDFSPFVRNSPVTTLISSFCLSLTRTVINQGIVQRYKSLPTYRKARVISIFSHIGNATLLFLPIIFGVIMYASYHDCDPGMSKLLEDTNQLSIYYILDKSRNIPGFIGLLIACVLSAAFSTMSTIMNSVSAVLYEDFLKPLIPWELTTVQTNIIIKSSVIILGIINAVCIFALDDIGSIYQGAIAGGLVSLTMSIWLGLGIQFAVSSGKIKYHTKIVSIEGCSPNITEKLDLNVTTEGYLGYVPTSFDDDLPYPYRLSFNLISFLAVITSIIVGLIVSIVSSNDEAVDESLLIPQLRKTKKDEEIFSAEEMEILNAAN